MRNPSMRDRRFDPHRFFYFVKLYAIEVAATIIFLSWLARAVWCLLDGAGSAPGDLTAGNVSIPYG